MYKVEYKLIESMDGGEKIEHVKKTVASLTSVEPVLRSPYLEFITVRRVKSQLNERTREEVTDGE
jgi:hypothetical protein